MINPCPWLVPAAVDALAAIIRPDWQILETGAGGSTIWLAERAGRVITLEHNPTWYQEVRAELDRRHLGNAEVRLVPGYIQAGLASYGVFDLVLVDGRGRVKSCGTARVKPGGYLVLDNSERERYRPAIELVDARGWQRTDYKGQWQTSIWRAL